MMRNLIALGCAVLLAAGLSFGTFAGSISDDDGDGVPNGFDNCSLMPNGPLAAPTFPAGSTCGQEDRGGGPPPLNTDAPDGYGNACDYDVTNDNIVTLADLGLNLGAIGGTDLEHDFNCDELVTLADLGAMLPSVGATGTVLLASDLPCAGAAPCTGP
jgi:hypothetical protein